MASFAKYPTQAGDRWMVRYRKPTGKSTEKRGFKTKRDASTWAATSLLDKNSGTFISESARRRKVGELITEHLARTAAKTPSTAANRQFHASKWTMPKWEGWSVGDIANADVQDWVQDMSDSGAGAATIEKAVGVLRGALRLAVTARLVPANVALELELPRAQKRKNLYLTHGDVFELADAIRPESRTIVLFLAYTGLRFGEAAALTIGDLDLPRRRINLRTSVTEVLGVMETGPTKSKRSRSVPMPAFIADLVATQTAGRLKAELVFPGNSGSPIRLNNWRPRTFNVAIAAVNAARAEAAHGKPFEPFPKVTPHDLRHAAASLAIHAGANVKSVQRMLGHASAAVTLDIYADLFEDDLDGVADALGKAAEQWSTPVSPETKRL
ncbi:tyrosine-type recombinase/integrase [Cryobacterium sp. GrIS_2_6]|uniref:tyrosine-type recombinase/integrase n=1 Tax=Cryobacterium sp. GrIS_2_6 TaxID=3162785 RepID=UPI002E038CA1|nr:tyrosine-type recombinase/integrase [Cryobacterium psychrotolerans]MEC5149539.1 integrase [Cryobacterium psychrotolerans]